MSYLCPQNKDTTHFYGRQHHPEPPRRFETQIRGDGAETHRPRSDADVKQFIQLTKEYKELEPIIETSERYRTAIANLAEAKETREEYIKALNGIKEARELLDSEQDPEMREMAREMIAELEPQLAQMEEGSSCC